MHPAARFSFFYSLYLCCFWTYLAVFPRIKYTAPLNTMGAMSTAKVDIIFEHSKFLTFLSTIFSVLLLRKISLSSFSCLRRKSINLINYSACAEVTSRLIHHSSFLIPHSRLPAIIPTSSLPLLYLFSTLSLHFL